jgi:hypothetical protein
MIRLTPLQIAGSVLAVLGGLAAVVQLLDYVKSGKLNLILASIVGAVAVGGVAAILVQRARRDAWIGAGLAFLVVVAAYGAVALYRSDVTSQSTASVPTSQQPPSPNPGGETTIYIGNQMAISPDNIEVSGLRALSRNNPPQINDSVTVQFSLKNVGQQPVTLKTAFIAARNPANENKDFAKEAYNRVLAPGDVVDIRSFIFVTEKGGWQFWPCYGIGHTLCPNEWQIFQITVV